MVAGKVVPPAPARRRGLPAAGVGELARVAARGWPALEEDELGGWRLRAAGGFTRRANSVLPLGDPGIPVPEALARVRAWYAARALPAYVLTTSGAEDTDERLAAALAEQGWHQEVAAEVWIAGLAPVAEAAAAGAAARTADPGAVELARSVDARWLRRYQRFTEPAPEVTAVLGGGPSVWFATLDASPDQDADTDAGPAPDAPAAAIGRVVVDGRWAGFAAVETDPALRRRGLATAVMSALADRALEEGASAAYLQVEADNGSARLMYDRLGFARHHGYQYWRAPKD